MNFNLLLTLEHMALVKIAAALWNQEEIRTLIAKSREKDKWLCIEQKVMDKVPLLTQPGLFRKKILHFIEVLGLEILKWRDAFDKNCFVFKNLPQDICWTPQGVIDEKKTVKGFMADESLEITVRYKLACVYCLEDEIPKLWVRIPANRKKTFYKRNKPQQVRQKLLVVLWTYDMKGQLSTMNPMIERRSRRKCTPYQYAFEYAADNNNKVATKHFVQKLSPEEKRQSIIKSVLYLISRVDFRYDHYTERADALFFLHTQLDEKQQARLLRTRNYAVTLLSALIKWPWQSLFMEAVNSMWGFLSAHQIYCMFCTVVFKIRDGYKDYDYRNLFREFWRQSLQSLKRHDENERDVVIFLTVLCKIEDVVSIELVFKDVSVAGKKTFIFSHGRDICEYLLSRNRWNLLKLVVGECLSTRDETMKFKADFRRHAQLYYSGCPATKAERLNRFSQYLDDLISGYGEKRNMEEGDSSLAKRFRNAQVTNDEKK